MKIFAVLLAIVSITVPTLAHAQADSSTNALQQTNPVTIAYVISGKLAPLSVQVKDLNSDWRHIVIGEDKPDLGQNKVILRSLASFTEGFQTIYYTKGDTVLVGNETYLIAYSLKTKPFDPAIFEPGELPKPEKLTLKTILSLSLLNLRNVGNIIDIRPFDMKEELAQSEPNKNEGTEVTESQDASIQNLSQLAAALRMYAVDEGDNLPNMSKQSEVVKAMRPYVQDKNVFNQPDTNMPYAINPVLTNHKVAHIANPSEMVVFYEANPRPDNTRAVAFLDCHAMLVSEDQWPDLKRKSKIR